MNLDSQKHKKVNRSDFAAEFNGAVESLMTGKLLAIRLTEIT